MEDSGLLIQTLILIIVIPSLVLFYWYIGFRILVIIISTIKAIWNNTE
jgi:hypothetical protein